MSSEIIVAIVTAVLTAITATVAALVAQTLKARSAVDEGLRSQRLEVYPRLWAMQAEVSRWPRHPATFASLRTLHQAMRHWYYATGGMYLSERARGRYGDAQEMIEAVLATPHGDDDALPAGMYGDVMLTCSWLRTSLAEDLETRRKNSVGVAWDRAEFHAEAHAEAQRRKAAPGTVGKTKVPGRGSLLARHRRNRRNRRALLSEDRPR